MYNPKVSIIIPVYNGHNYLQQSIDSALNQTYSNIEVIVINDGSTDDGKTEEIALKYKGKVKYLKKENGGVASALNYGISIAEGEYISWLSHDDLYDSKKIEKQVKEIVYKKNIYHDSDIILFSSYMTINKDGKIIKKFSIPPYITNNIRCLLSLDTEYTLNGCTMLLPKKVIIKFGGFDEKLKYTQDYDFWWKISSFCRFEYMDECLIKSRQHDEQDSKKCGLAVSKEADLFRAKSIGELTNNTVISYCRNDMSNLIDIYHIYKNAGYINTSVEMLNLMAKLLLDDISSVDKLLIKSTIIEELNIVNIDTRKVFELSQRKEKKRVLVFTNVWRIGGLEKVVSGVMNSLCNEYEFVLVSLYEEGVLGCKICNDIEWIRLNALIGIKKIIPCIAKFIKADMVWSHPNLLEECLEMYEVLNMLSIPSIATNHYGYFLPYKYEWLHSIIGKRINCLRHASLVTWATDFNNCIYSQLNDNGITVGNINTYKINEYEQQNRKNIVLCVGRFYDYVKRIDRILDIFELMSKQNDDIKFVLVGGYSLDMIVNGNKSLKDRLQEIGELNNRLELLGEQEDVKKYYAEAKVLLSTSESEGFGMVLTEAGTMGLPVVAYKYPGIDDIIDDNINGILLEPDDSESAVIVIKKLIYDKILWTGMSQNAIKLSKRFDSENIVKKWDKVFSMVIDSKTIDYNVLEKSEIKTIKYLKTIVMCYERCVDKLLSTHYNNQKYEGGYSLININNTVNYRLRDHVKDYIRIRISKYPLLYKMIKYLYKLIISRC
ncbi:MAG: glycosyltransferase [Selenomonadaceae bacterium]|nr:glycosyltransferase [Selenomonadaceae bacterium]